MSLQPTGKQSRNLTRLSKMQTQPVRPSTSDHQRSVTSPLSQKSFTRILTTEGSEPVYCDQKRFRKNKRDQSLSHLRKHL